MDTLPIDQILQGDTLAILPALPASSVDLIFADPPYNLQLQQDLWRPNLTQVDAVDDDWDQFDDFAAYDTFTRAWLTEARRVMKNTATIWVSGTYHNIFRVGSIMQDLGFWMLNTVVWHKCLASTTRLYAKTYKGEMPTMLKDLVRLDPKSVKLWNGEKWVQVVDWVKSPLPTRTLRITLRTGERIRCSPEHRWITQRGLVCAGELRVGDVLQSCTLPEPECRAEPSALDDEIIGWYVGLYIAEGSRTQKAIQIASHVKETERYEKLCQLADAFDGTCVMYHTSENGATINLHGPMLRAIIDTYVTGNTANKKHLSMKCWQRSNRFLKAVLDGYLSGDGSYDPKNQRWRLGFTRNYAWENDLRTLCARLGLSLRLNLAINHMNGKPYKGYRGELRFTRSHMKSHKPDTEIMDIREWGSCDLWDVCLADEPHLFSLASGVLSHNSNAMPNFRGTRLKNDLEFVIWAKRSEKSTYTFNHHQMKQFNAGKQLGSMWPIPACGGQERLKDAQGKKLHPTQKPEELLRRIIVASSNSGDVVLDPFLGSGTTAAVAKQLHRQWIGIERDPIYVQAAQTRIDHIQPLLFEDLADYTPEAKPARVPFSALLREGYLRAGQTLYLDAPDATAVILDDGRIQANGFEGSIHRVGALLKNAPSCNGWAHWQFVDEASGQRHLIDDLRNQLRLKSEID